MTLLTEQDKQRVAEAIKEVERHTDAELVTVLARRADDYTWISTLWAALLALLVPGLLSFGPWWLSGYEWLMVQWVLFSVLALVFRIPAVTIRLLPRSLRRLRAARLARYQFLEQGLHHTKNDTGVLLFVSEAEHYVEILADRGINQHVAPDAWERVVATLTGHIRKGQTLQGFLASIEQVGELLKTHVPATSEKNELPNHLVVLD